MKYDEFWESSVRQRGAWYQAHLYELEDKNLVAWIQGIYVLKAVHPKKGSKTIEYESEPIRITPMTEEEKEQKEQEELQQFQSFFDGFGEKIGNTFTGERLD